MASEGSSDQDRHEGRSSSREFPTRQEAEVNAVAEKAANETVLVTAEGYERLRSELEALRLDGRREVSERLGKAREDGDLADNPALYDLLVEQAQLERRIATLEAQVAAAQIVEPSATGVAGIGTSVRVRDLATGEIAEYELVGEIESGVGNGRVSVAAPVGRALAGRDVGERVDVETPRRPLSLKILGVRPLVGAQRDRIEAA
jgi:transcription elongation factor GreA